MRISDIFTIGSGWGYRYAGHNGGHEDYPGDDFNGRQDICKGNRCGGGGDDDSGDTRDGLLGFLG